MSLWQRLAFRAKQFDPRRLANCTSWFDASSASTLTFNATTISSWANLVSGGTAYAQATASIQPTTTTLGGRTALTFAGGNSTTTARLDGPTLNQLADNTNNVLVAFFVARFTGTTNATNRCWSTTDVWQGGGGFGWFPRYSNGQAYFDAPESTARVNASVTSTTITTGPTVCRLIRSGANASMHYNANQIASRSNASGAIHSILSNATRIAGPDGGNSFAVAEIITYSRVLSAAEIQAVERYLGGKYRVAIP